jgi:hypothetical protein
MSEPRKIRRFASLDVPYASVRERLYGLMGDAIGPKIQVHSVCHEDHSAGLPELTRVTLGCGHAASSAQAAFDMSSAEVYASALSDAGTQLEIEGHWTVQPDAALDASVERAAVARADALLEALVECLQSDVQSAKRAREFISGAGPAARSD